MLLKYFLSYTINNTIKFTQRRGAPVLRQDVVSKEEMDTVFQVSPENRSRNHNEVGFRSC
ncbi:hypothetical protein ANANG_G00220400 [Anguilla anguilla]|uniref:Uncharacterized protein n=1 Tax=Anguilla anguilla TaxID=7936 RepID=A0A9D3M3S9_ANGAN|nr:hypothetical protein ANANG_G00220400 [Anguilla anguilla]